MKRILILGKIEKSDYLHSVHLPKIEHLHFLTYIYKIRVNLI